MENDDGGKRSRTLGLAQRSRDVQPVLRLDPGLQHGRIRFAHHVDVFLIRQRVGAPGVARDLAMGGARLNQEHCRDEKPLHAFTPKTAHRAMMEQASARPASPRAICVMRRRAARSWVTSAADWASAATTSFNCAASWLTCSALLAAAACNSAICWSSKALRSAASLSFLRVKAGRTTFMIVSRLPSTSFP